MSETSKRVLAANKREKWRHGTGEWMNAAEDLADEVEALERRIAELEAEVERLRFAAFGAVSTCPTCGNDTGCHEVDCDTLKGEQVTIGPDLKLQELVTIRAENWQAVLSAIDVWRERAEKAERRIAELEAERDEAVALAREMWGDAEGWSGPRASSHYRSKISERLAALKGGGG